MLRVAGQFMDPFPLLTYVFFQMLFQTSLGFFKAARSLLIRSYRFQYMYIRSITDQIVSST